MDFEKIKPLGEISIWSNDFFGANVYSTLNHADNHWCDNITMV